MRRRMMMGKKGGGGDYLAFTAVNGPSVFNFYGGDLYYSLNNGSSWTLLPAGTDTPTVAEGETILWKGNLVAGNNGSGTFRVTSSSGFNASGNLMSIVYGDNFEGQDTVTYDYQFAILFQNNAWLIDASEMVVPSNYNGHSGVFTMAFFNCSRLEAAPALTAPILTASCYNLMFYQCVKLAYVKCLATDISASQCTSNWMFGVPSSSGTFVKAALMTSWPSGTSGIPSGWTIQNE